MLEKTEFSKLKQNDLTLHTREGFFSSISIIEIGKKAKKSMHDFLPLIQILWFFLILFACQGISNLQGL